MHTIQLGAPTPPPPALYSPAPPRSHLHLPRIILLHLLVESQRHSQPPLPPHRIGYAPRPSPPARPTFPFCTDVNTIKVARPPELSLSASVHAPRRKSRERSFRVLARGSWDPGSTPQTLSSPPRKIPQKDADEGGIEGKEYGEEEGTHPERRHQEREEVNEVAGGRLRARLGGERTRTTQTEEGMGVEMALGAGAGRGREATGGRERVACAGCERRQRESRRARIKKDGWMEGIERSNVNRILERADPYVVGRDREEKNNRKEKKEIKRERNEIEDIRTSILEEPNMLQRSLARANDHVHFLIPRAEEKREGDKREREKAAGAMTRS
ncbi:hypothetical protein B0H11DRAFT_1910018 [Mycena galericulata]|nr:hypothetical protein B0H11DRAFT_1910018 [Mycena galericulata]